MARSKGQKARKKAGTISPPPGQEPYEVYMAKPAEDVYVALYKRCKEAQARGDVSNAHCTTFSIVSDAVKNIIPRDPLSKNHALSGDLSGIFRLHKGRMRICWVASSESRAVWILFISETVRKAGDVNDPYRIFTQMVMSGQYKEIFTHIGIAVPAVHNLQPPQRM
jgi:hypothetical protein